MQFLLRLSRAMDAISDWVGRTLIWALFATVIVSTANAVVRKVFSVGSNAWLEVQWYLFAAVFLLGAGYAFLHNAHVRIDFVSSKLSARTNAIIDALGIVVFTIPLSLIMIDLGWPLFLRAWQTGEMSQNAGGLIRWPVLALLPAGFAILCAQAVSELIKRLAFLAGARDEPFSIVETKSAEELLIEKLAAEAEAKTLAQAQGSKS